MDEHDRDAMPPLQAAQVVEQWCDLGGDVLVDPVQPDEGVEHQQHRAQRADRLLESPLVELDVEAQDGRDDHVDVQRVERGPYGGRDPGEPLSHDGRRVLGGEEQDPAAAGRGKPSEAGRARRDGHGHVEGEEGLAALGLAAEDADRLGGPQALDQPALLLGAGVELVRTADGQRGHDRFFVSGRGLGAGTW